MALRDPRKIITPDAFTVAPDLLGIGLARPARRLLAIAIDGIMIAIFSNLGGKVLFALGAGVMLWRAGTARTPGPGDESLPDRRWVRNGLRVAGAVALVVFVWTAYDWVSTRAKKMAVAPGVTVNVDKDNDDKDDDSTNTNLAKYDLGLGDWRAVALMSRFERADDSAAAAPFADSIALRVRDKPDSVHAELAGGILEALSDAPGAPALQAALAPLLPVDSLANADSLQRELGQLRGQVKTLRTQNGKLRSEAKDADEGFSVKRIFKSVSDVLGFGLGWSALYFTAFTLLMRGQTPGKKLLGIRVIRLDGRPITGWIAFERFGGYAAAAATGLLGFAQILWDRNRQGIHDKVAETVVIREHRGVPTRPLDAIGGAQASRPLRSPPPSSAGH